MILSRNEEDDENGHQTTNQIIDTETTPLLRSHDHDHQGPSARPIDLPGYKKMTIFAATWTGVFLVALDSTIVATLSPSIASSFSAANEVSWLATSYLLSLSATATLYGRLSNLIGRRLSLSIALTLFTIGTIACGLSTSINSFILARFVAGMGGGGVMTTSSIISCDLVPLNQRGLIQGLTSTCFGAGAALGGPLGGWLSDVLGWRYPFLVQVPVLVLAMGMVAYFIDYHCEGEATNKAELIRRIDWWGSLTLVLWNGSLLLSLSFKNDQQYPWTDPRVYLTLLSFLVFLVAFLYIEARVASEPVLPIKLLKLKSPSSIACIYFLISVLYMYPMYLETVASQTSSEAGLHLVPNSISIAVGSLLAGFLIRLTSGHKTITMAGTIFFGTGSALMVATGLRQAWSQWIAIVPIGFGFASVLNSLLVGLMVSVSTEEMAIATAFTYLFRYTGQVVGVGISGAILQNVLVRELTERITGPGSLEIIDQIRKQSSIIPDLPTEAFKLAARESYSKGLMKVFECNLILSGLAVLVAFGIDESIVPNICAQVTASFDGQACHFTDLLIPIPSGTESQVDQLLVMAISSVI
ncbi:major facilitator superfamily domain-containing protein [Melampsora americana]|nr:major facilitator superfamily domain-containing protein [Melampsora americana]